MLFNPFIFFRVKTYFLLFHLSCLALKVLVFGASQITCRSNVKKKKCKYRLFNERKITDFKKVHFNQYSLLSFLAKKPIVYMTQHYF